MLQQKLLMRMVGVKGIKLSELEPGHLRVKVDKVKDEPGFAAKLEKRLSRIRGIDSIETDAATGSVVIDYDSGSLKSSRSFRALATAMETLFPEIDMQKLLPKLREML